MEHLLGIPLQTSSSGSKSVVQFRVSSCPPPPSSSSSPLPPHLLLLSSSTDCPFPWSTLHFFQTKHSLPHPSTILNNHAPKKSVFPGSWSPPISFSLFLQLLSPSSTFLSFWSLYYLTFFFLSFTTIITISEEEEEESENKQHKIK